MKNILESLNDALVKADVKAALLDREEKLIRILVNPEQKKEFVQVIKSLGGKQQKDKSKDLYLYGMDHFMYFIVDNVKLIACFQLACRSTLNGEWVPLDRIINNFALDRVVSKKENVMPVPCPEDYLCYILAKCVYTDEQFGEYDIDRIQKCLEETKEPQLSDKLKGVFFNFTTTMITMLKEHKYKDIIEALWCYSEY